MTVEVGRHLCADGSALATEQLYGVEIEVENCREFEWVHAAGLWRATGDGSLRRNGMEFISPPAPMSTIRSMLEDYYRHASALGYESNIRTGIHVHMDMRSRTLDEVAMICAMYSIVEPALFTLCGPEREECIYCVPWYRSNSDAVLLGELLAETRHRTVRSRLDESCKYSALYLEPLRRFGTLEFRSAPTFTSLSDMLRWIDVLTSVVNVALRYEDVEALVTDAEQNLENLVTDVLWDDVDVQSMCSLIEMEDSIGTARTLVHTRTEEFDWEHPVAEVSAEASGYYRYAPNASRGRPEPPRTMRATHARVREQQVEWDDEIDEFEEND